MPSTTPTQFRPEALKASLELLDSYQPDRVYLTHYGALEYSREQQRALLEQIDAYVEITCAANGNASAIEEAIIVLSQARTDAMNPGQAPENLRDKFRHDASLNAQGLAVWHQRQQA